MFTELKEWFGLKAQEDRLNATNNEIDKVMERIQQAKNDFRLTMCAYSCTLAGGGSNYLDNLKYWQEKLANGDVEAEIVINKVNEINGELAKSIN